MYLIISRVDGFAYFEFIVWSCISRDVSGNENTQHVFLLPSHNDTTINDNSRYIEMHLDRLSEDLLYDLYGKQIEGLEKKDKKLEKDED